MYVWIEALEFSLFHTSDGLEGLYSKWRAALGNDDE